MKRWMLITACAAALALGACASGSGAAGAGDAAALDSSPPATAPQTPAPMPTASGYTDAQIQSFVAARRAINELTPGATPEAQAQNQQRISTILQENNIAPDVYNQIATAARTDQALSERISVAAVGDDFTDMQLRAFIAASAEIEPLTPLLSGAPEEQAQAAEQVRAILTRNSLDIETYNGIAAQARTNAELQARLQALNTQMQMPADAPSGSE